MARAFFLDSWHIPKTGYYGTEQMFYKYGKRGIMRSQEFRNQSMFCAKILFGAGGAGRFSNPKAFSFLGRGGHVPVLF